MSGLIPGAIRRNTLRIARRPKTTLVLLCSAPDIRGGSSIGNSTSGSRLKTTAPHVACWSNNVRRYVAAAGS